jgi:hypothetical protein
MFVGLGHDNRSSNKLPVASMLPLYQLSIGGLVSHPPRVQSRIRVPAPPHLPSGD